MKKSIWAIPLLALLATVAWVASRESRTEPAKSPVVAPARTESRATAARIGSPPAATAGEEAAANPRSRPLPRPEDPKHKPAPPLQNSHPIAVAVKDKPGFVFSPFNDKIVDVRDIPPGTLVADPTYPSAEGKYFRVP